MTPDRRRAAVVGLVDRFGVSERRACRVVGQHRSTQRRAAAVRADADAVYGAWLCEFAQAHPREVLAIRVDHSIDADGVVEVVEAIAATRGTPGHLRMDNGPELAAEALRDWCKLSGTATAYIEPGAPWENGHIESFNGRLRDECLNIEDFANLLEAQVVLED